MIGDTAVHDFAGYVTVTVTVAYTPPAGLARDDYDLLTVYYLDASGNIQEIKDAVYDPVTRTITFKTNHFSSFFVSEWINPFSDMKKTDWFYRAVRFAYSDGLMTGVAPDIFSPDTPITRAMLVTILYRMTPGANSEFGIRNSEFSDVGAGMWYSDAVAWAASNGIVEGYGDGRFGTNDSITREQLATMLYRYNNSQFTIHNAQLGDGGNDADLSVFTDGGSTSAWAADAVRWAIAKGIITGISDTTVAPQGNATRAQTATMLQRFDGIIH